MRRKKSGLTQRVEYLAVQAAAALVTRARPGKLDRWAKRIAGLAERLSSRRTKLAEENLRRVFPEKSVAECHEIIDRCWTHFARTTLEFLRTMDEPLDRLNERFDIQGWEHVDATLARDRGAIVVTAHLGSWEFALSQVSRVDRKVTIVARALDNELLHAKIAGARGRSQVQFAERRHAARPLIRTLEQKGIVILVADQAVQPREGILVPFLGRPAWTISAPARLSLKYGAPIVCVFCRPSGERFVLEIERPIVPDELPESERTVEGITRRMNDSISAQIRRTPELWLWMHNRWKFTE